MNNLPYWGIAAIQIWICTRELSYVQKRLTGDAQRDEIDGWDVLAEFHLGSSNCEHKDLPEGWEKRSLLVSKEQAKAELLAKLRSGELRAQGIKCDPRNDGRPDSYTAQAIPICDWGYLRLRAILHKDRYAAFYEHDDIPSWRHVVCPGAMVRQLWPQDQTETPEAAPASQAAPGPAKRKRVTKQRIAEEAGRELFPCGGLASMTTQEISAAIGEAEKRPT